eukprot:1183220-Prorocentrum_minimum.AAC.1
MISPSERTVSRMTRHERATVRTSTMLRVLTESVLYSVLVPLAAASIYCVMSYTPSKVRVQFCAARVCSNRVILSSKVLPIVSVLADRCPREVAANAATCTPGTRELVATRFGRDVTLTHVDFRWCVLTCAHTSGQSIRASDSSIVSCGVSCLGNLAFVLATSLATVVVCTRRGAAKSLLPTPTVRYGAAIRENMCVLM